MRLPEGDGFHWFFMVKGDRRTTSAYSLLCAHFFSAFNKSLWAFWVVGV